MSDVEAIPFNESIEIKKACEGGSYLLGFKRRVTFLTQRKTAGRPKASVGAARIAAPAQAAFPGEQSARLQLVQPLGQLDFGPPSIRQECQRKT
jgi:hypothetical protein